MQCRGRRRTGDEEAGLRTGGVWVRCWHRSVFGGHEPRRRRSGAARRSRCVAAIASVTWSRVRVHLTNSCAASPHHAHIHQSSLLSSYVLHGVSRCRPICLALQILVGSRTHARCKAAASEELRGSSCKGMRLRQTCGGLPASRRSPSALWSRLLASPDALRVRVRGLLRCRPCDHDSCASESRNP